MQTSVLNMKSFVTEESCKNFITILLRYQTIRATEGILEFHDYKRTGLYRNEMIRLRLLFTQVVPGRSITLPRSIGASMFIIHEFIYFQLFFIIKILLNCSLYVPNTKNILHMKEETQ